MSDRPVLLLDVDGVISLFGFDVARLPPGEWTNVHGVVHRISAAAGAQVARLAEAYALVWCTGWEEKANEILVPMLGLPGPLATLSFGGGPGGDGRHWKLGAIEDHVGPHRPVAWVDDDHDHPTVHDWIAGRPGPTLLVRTQPPTGLTDPQVERLLSWAERPRR